MATVNQNADYDDIAEKHAPEDAPPRPDNPILERRAWAKMWLEDNNVVWVVVGDTGDGKSYASLRLGEVLDPNFSINNVASNIVEFMQHATEDHPRGTVTVLEEASVEASSYDWHDDSNRIFAKLLDTWRHQNRMAIINLPNFKSLEKGARRRTKGIVKMQHAAPWRDYSQAKFYDAKYGNIEDRFTTPFPVIDGKQRKYIRFNMPSEQLREAYEAQKKEYTGELNADMLETLLDAQEEEEAEDKSAKDIADEILRENLGEQYIKEYNGRKSINQDLIEVDFDIGARKGGKVKAKLEQKLLA